MRILKSVLRILSFRALGFALIGIGKLYARAERGERQSGLMAKLG